MKSNTMQTILMIFVFSIVLAGMLWSSDSELGTWLRTDALGKGMTVKIEVSGTKGGRKLTYQVLAQNQMVVMIVDSPMDGTDVPVIVSGKPSGMTMAMKRVDDHHVNSVEKVNGQTFITSKGTFSDDFSTLTVEDEINPAAAGNQPTKQTETWVRK